MTDYTGIDNLEVMREAKNYNAFLHSIIDAQIRPQDRVVDFGAGSGTFAIPLLERGVEIVCIEQDSRLRQTLRRAKVPIVATIDEISSASVDVVYSLNVLEHIDDDRNAVYGLAERLKDGGRLLLYVPAFPVLFSAMDRKVGHHRRYRRGPLVTLLNDAGFSVRRAVYVDSLGFVLTIGYRMVGNDTGEVNQIALKLYDRFFFRLSRLLASEALEDRIPVPELGMQIAPRRAGTRNPETAGCRRPSDWDRQACREAAAQPAPIVPRSVCFDPRLVSVFQS